MNRRTLIVIFLLSLCCIGAVRADNIEVTASVDKQTAYIGDLIAYTVTVTYDSTITLEPPAVGVNLGQFDVKDYKVGEEQKIENGRCKQELWFHMRTFTTGEYIIPPLPIEYRLSDSTMKTISSDPIKINIKSMIAEGSSVDTMQFRDLKPQISMETGLSDWTIVLIIAFVLLAVGASIGWWLKRSKGDEEYIDPRPAWEIAFAELAELKDKDLLGQGDLKPFYFELTEIMRRYLSKKFEFDAIELTTSEIDDYFRELEYEASYIDGLRQFMEHANLVKFAKYIPPADRPDEDWQEAYRIVDTGKDLEVKHPAEEIREIYIPQRRSSSDDDEGEWKFAPPGYRELMATRQGSAPEIETIEESGGPDDA